MMRSLDRKLWRTLRAMRMQALAIALVIMSGAGIFIMSLSTLHSLYETRATYYKEQGFAHVFARLKRAPLSLATRIAEIPGVDRVETRVIAYVNVDVEGLEEPASAHLISFPDVGEPLLNRLYLRAGQGLETAREDQVMVTEEFANANSLGPGDTLRATINGRRRTLRIAGLVLSPEYIYQIAPGAMFPDFSRYGVMWMARSPLATAFDMDGAFNDVTLTLTRGVAEEDVITRLDDLLAPYGGLGAHGREDQLSHRFLSEELKQQRTTATVFPIIFFAVAAFLLNVVISRLIALERGQIATLKAFGYSNFDIGLHYSKLVLAIVAIGVMAGIALGIWMGRGMSNLYMDFYSFPYMIIVLRPEIFAWVSGVSIVVALAGTLYSVHGAASLAPAQAMRPEPPGTFGPALAERLGLGRWLTQPTRMILRHIERRPWKSTLTTVGLALASSIMMLGGYQAGAIDYMIDIQYGMSLRADLTATFSEPTSARALHSLHSIPGVEHVEGMRSVPARLRFGHRSYRTTLDGLEEGGTLFRLLDADLKPIRLPERGVVVTDHLAKLLHIKMGDSLQVEVLEGERRTLLVPVAATAKEYLGVGAYMRRDALNRLLREGDAVSGAHMRVPPAQRTQVYRELKEMPRIAGVVEQTSAVDAFYETLARSVLYFIFVSTLLGATISFGVVYNSMRIALSERSRELASLRVLGFRRTEVAYILLGEFALLTIISLPLGFLVGYGLCAYLSREFASDLYRIPLVMEPDIFAFACVVVIASALVSGVLMWRALAHLDMVAVLKAAE